MLGKPNTCTYPLCLAMIPVDLQQPVRARGLELVSGGEGTTQLQNGSAGTCSANCQRGRAEHKEILRIPGSARAVLLLFIAAVSGLSPHFSPTYDCYCWGNTC